MWHWTKMGLNNLKITLSILLNCSHFYLSENILSLGKEKKDVLLKKDVFESSAKFTGNTCTTVSRAKTFQNTYFVDHDILCCWFNYWKLNISEHVFGKIMENKTIRKSYYWLIPQKKDCKTLFLKFFILWIHEMSNWNYATHFHFQVILIFGKVFIFLFLSFGTWF